MSKIDTSMESRRGSGPEAGAYLKAVGHRVRVERQRLGLSRRALAEASGVSERYLAELERGAGNASLLVLREVALALRLRVEDLACEPPSDVPRNVAAE
jgi:XRE family transcriptional regulator, aerobic/anaerobic benzoate catabolism transcriptional regulator